LHALSLSTAGRRVCRASKSFSTFLTDRHVTHVFHESGGAHTWIVWRRYLNEVAPLLFQSTGEQRRSQR